MSVGVPCFDYFESPTISKFLLCRVVASRKKIRQSALSIRLFQAKNLDSTEGRDCNCHSQESWCLVMSEGSEYVSFPPWQASFFVGGLLAFSLQSLPQDIDEIATVETFTQRIFPEFLSLTSLAIIRLGIAATIWMVTIHMIFYGRYVIETTYRPDSRLVNASLKMHGLGTLYPFTSWCWIMLGLNFSFSGYIALMACTGHQREIQQWILRAALVFWELSAPFALLVSAIVRYAIWPVVLAAGKKHELGCFRNQMQHNVNSFYVLLETALLGGIPLRVSHLSLPMLVGSIYIIFTWFNCFSFADKSYGPQYIYWFMDPTLGRQSVVALVVLLTVLVLSFLIFYSIEAIIHYADKSLMAHILCVLLVTSAVIKAK